MKTLNIFLEALRETLELNQGCYIPIITTVESRFPAIKKIKLEVYYRESSVNKCLSTEEYSFNSNIVSKEEATETIVKTTIKNLLKFYGI